MAEPDHRSPSVSHEGLILAHATLIALTPLIPVPFVDSAIEASLLRRMVRSLAKAHRLELAEDDVHTLADDESESLVAGMVKGAALMPVKLILRKLFVVLTGRKMVQLASECYHRGWLLDRTFAAGWCAPAGPHPPRAIRLAIDGVLVEVPIATSPVTEALRTGLKRSRRALVSLFDQLRQAFGSRRDEAAKEHVARILEEADGEERTGLGAVVAQLRKAVTEVPQEHFDGLQRRLESRLGPS